MNGQHSGLRGSKQFIDLVQKDILKLQAQLENLKPVDPAQEDEVVKKLDEILRQVHSDAEHSMHAVDRCVANMARAYLSIEAELPKSPLFLKQVTPSEVLQSQQRRTEIHWDRVASRLARILPKTNNLSSTQANLHNLYMI